MRRAKEVLDKLGENELEETERKSGTLYLISYDLTLPDRDYKTLHRELRKMGAKPVLKSQWAVKLNNTTTTNLRDLLSDFLDDNDVLLVTLFTSWASFNLSTDFDKL